MTAKTEIPPLVGVVIGMFFYELSDTFLYLIQPVLFPTLFRLLGLIILLYYLSRSSFQYMGNGISMVFRIMIIWTVLMLLRGSLIGNFLPGKSFSIIGIIRDALLSPYGAFAFLLPLFSLLKFNLRSLYYLKKIAILLCVISLLMVLLYWEQLANGLIAYGMTTLSGMDGEEVTVRSLISAIFPGFGIVLLALFYSGYINSRYSLLFPITCFIFFIGCAIGGGRGMTFFSLFYLLFFFYIQFKKPFSIQNGILWPQFGKRKNHIFYLILLCGFIIALVYLYNSTNVFDYVFERAFGAKTIEGGDFQNESRNTLVRDFVNDFNDHPLDWIWGRGINGTYATSHLSINGRRAWMEYSYYYLILKGGIVYLFLFTYCLIHASYLGMFKSKNYLSKCFSLMCIALLLNMFSSGAEPRYTTQFALSWICFGLLERREFRMMRDIDIYGYFNNKNYTRQ